MTGQTNEKSSVNYRTKHKKCGTCGHFNGRSECTQVEGRISEDAMCDLWEIIVPTETNKRMFIKNAYNNSVKKGEVNYK